jgi:hypothetical protein
MRLFSEVSQGKRLILLARWAPDGLTNTIKKIGG